MTGKPFRILFVDAGNYSRSPAAEIFAARLLTTTKAGAPVAARSAGLKDKHAGGGADPRTIAACARRGYDLTHFIAREIGEADFRGGDLILAMDASNLDELKRRAPGDCAVRIALFLGDAEVPDPYFGDEANFDIVIGLIETRVRELARIL